MLAGDKIMLIKILYRVRERFTKWWAGWVLAIAYNSILSSIETSKRCMYAAIILL